MIKLSEDRVLPKVMTNRTKLTHAPYLAIMTFFLLSALIYVTCLTSLDVLSQMSVLSVNRLDPDLRISF